MVTSSIRDEVLERFRVTDKLRFLDTIKYSQTYESLTSFPRSKVYIHIETGG